MVFRRAEFLKYLKDFLIILSQQHLFFFRGKDDIYSNAKLEPATIYKSVQWLLSSNNVFC